MTELYFARHPESELNATPSLVSGRSNHVPVTPRGAIQAHLFSEAFTQQYPQPDVLYSSPAVRTKTLIEAYDTHSGLRQGYFIDPALQEMTQGLADGQPRAEIYTPEVITRIEQELFDFRLPEGESLRDVSERVLGWIYKVHHRHPNETLLIATHGQAIRAAVGSLLGWSHYDVTRNPAYATPNVSLTHMSVVNDEIKVNFVGRVIIDELAESTETHK